VFTTKQYPLDHPFIVHIAKTDNIYRYTITQPRYLEKLCAAFWPSLLTIILEKADIISPLITAQHVKDSFYSSIAVVDGERCGIEIKSTIIDITVNDKIILLRPGMISVEIINEVLLYGHSRCEK
jgi:L-threonylcarbamoyladenylate synthase